MGDTTRDKLTQLIQQNDKIVKFGRDPETIFKAIFQIALKARKGHVDWHGLTILDSKTEISSKEYEYIFDRHYNENDSIVQHGLENSLADSICAFYGIEREELVKIRKSKHLINKKKKEINELFENCLKSINEKFKAKEKAPENKVEAKQPVQDQTEAKQQPAPQQPAKPTPQEKQETKKAETPEKHELEICYNQKDKIYEYKSNINPGTKIENYTTEKFGNTLIEHRDFNGEKVIETYGTFKEIFKEKYKKLIENPNEDTNLRQIAYEFAKRTNSNDSKSSSIDPYDLENSIVAILGCIIKAENKEKNGKTSIKLENSSMANWDDTGYSHYYHRTYSHPVEMWITENVKINGKLARIDDAVTKVVEILGIKNELDAEYINKGGNEPDILVRAFRIAGLEDSLKDNIEEMKNIVMQKGLKAGYGYIETLYTEIKPLLTEEQQEVFDNLVKTKELVEKKENKKIRKQDVTFTIRKNSTKLLENKFKELGLDKSLKKTLSELIEITKKNGFKKALVFIPNIVEKFSSLLDKKQIEELNKIATQEKGILIPDQINESIKKDEVKLLSNKFSKLNKVDRINKKELKKIIKEAKKGSLVEAFTSLAMFVERNEATLDGNDVKELRNLVLNQPKKVLEEILNKLEKRNENKANDINTQQVINRVKGKIQTKINQEEKNISNFFNTISELDAKREAMEAEAERKAKEEAEKKASENIGYYFNTISELDSDRETREAKEKEAKEKEASMKAYNFFSNLGKNTPEEEAEAKAKLRANESRLNRAATRLKNFGLTLLKGTLDIATVGLFHKKLFEGRE